MFLRIRYAGDEARLQSGSELLFDDFYNGADWTVGLKELVSRAAPPLLLEILPVRADSPVYLPPAARARIAKTGQTAVLDSVRAVPLYRLSFSQSLASVTTGRQ